MNNAPYNRAVGFAMRLARKAAGLKTREMAKGVGLAQSQVSRLENGRLDWSVDQIATFCAYLEIDLDDVMALVSKSVAHTSTVADVAEAS